MNEQKEKWNEFKQTGKIEDYPFEKMDEYQSYDYVSDNGNYVISLAKNEKNKIKMKNL